MAKEQDMYKGELGYTQGFIRLVRNKISQLPKITYKTYSMKISDIYRPRSPKSTTLGAESVPVADRIKHGVGYIFSTDDITGEMTPKKRLKLFTIYPDRKHRTNGRIIRTIIDSLWMSDKWKL